MTKRISCQMVLIMTWMTTCVPLLMAQETRTWQASNSPTEAEEHKSEGYKLPEAEFAGSTSFRSGSLVQSLWSGLNFEGHYFGGNENNVGYTAGSWTFHGAHWKIEPGFGVAFGDNGFHTMPTLSFRWATNGAGSSRRACTFRAYSTPGSFPKAQNLKREGESRLFLR
jgi:hypothetical protein